MLKIIKFYKNECGPCAIVSNSLAITNFRNVEEVNVETKPELASKYGIMTVPVLVFEKDGVEVARRRGVVTPEVIDRLIDEHGEAAE